MKKIDFDFSRQDHHWQAGFADFPAGNVDHYGMDSRAEKLPAPLDTSKLSLMIQAINRSDDVFMFLKKRIPGLPKSTEFSCQFRLAFATNARPGAVGVGGSPAHSVFVKVGAVPFEPLASKANDDHIRMNLDKGNQANGGKDMIVIGDISNELPNSMDYRVVERKHTGKPLKVRTSPEGELWLIVGTDSGFEGLTRLYYTHIQIVLE